MFCPTCKSLLIRKTVRGKVRELCPQCDNAGPQAKPLPGPWWKDAKQGRMPDFSDAAKAAVKARPQVPASERRAPRTGGRTPREAPPPPEQLKMAPGTDLFPFGRIRAGQREFLGDVADAVAQKRHLLAHAPTGLGKTVSTLAPLVSYALAHQKRVFFLTSKQSQHKIAVDTLKAIRQKAGVPFVVADVIGKQDMCPRREAREMFSKRFAEFCRREQVTKSCEYWETANGPAIKVLKARVHHVEDLVIAATECGTCPHQAAIDLAAQAHVVVCDYNYFFSDMRASVQERLKIDLAEVLLVVDEAHNLPDRIRDHLTVSLSDYVLDDALDEIKDLGDDALARLVEVLRLVLSGLAEDAPAAEIDEGGGDDRFRDKNERYVERDEFIGAVNKAFSKKVSALVVADYDGLVDRVTDALETYAKKFNDDSRGLAELHEFLSLWQIERRGLARILTKEPTPSLHYKMLDPSILAKPVFDAVHASVVMSGTLHPMEMMRDVLGLSPERTTCREYASPFPKENRPVLVDTSVTTSYKERSEDMWRSYGERLAGIAMTTPGNVAAFFPSYAIMDQVRPYVEAGLGRRKELIVEEKGLDKSQKEALIGRMRSGLDARGSSGGPDGAGDGRVTDALLLGVQGGSLSEGYDYEGNLLKGVVIVGLPFAAPSLEVESLIAYYDKKFGPGYGRPYAYVHPTFHRVLQAAGRCIRSEDDRGVIVLMDKRFGWGSYRASYPRDFVPRESKDVAADVARFWATVKVPR